MGLSELFLLSAALASDAFAVSMSKGLSSRKKLFKTAISCALWFGFFQGFMPLFSYFFTSLISNEAERLAPYASAILLLALGIKTIKEAKEETICDDSISFRVMFALSLATSIDALAAGFTFAAFHANLIFSAAFIATITFILCFIGTALGAKIGARHGNKATFAGGVILILLAAKILAERILEL